MNRRQFMIGSAAASVAALAPVNLALANSGEIHFYDEVVRDRTFKDSVVYLHGGSSMYDCTLTRSCLKVQDGVRTKILRTDIDAEGHDSAVDLINAHDSLIEQCSFLNAESASVRFGSVVMG